MEQPFWDQPLLEKNKALIDRLNQDLVNIEYYRKYQDILRRIDLPIINKIGLLGIVMDVDTLQETLGEWQKICTEYDGINLDELNEETGKSIVEKLKPLVHEYEAELSQFLTAVKGGTDVSIIPDHLSKLKTEISTLAQKFGELPAYRVYRALSSKRGWE